MPSPLDPYEASLRERARQRLAAAKSPQAGPEDLTRLVEELQVHQVELEIQNEQLRQTQLALSESSRMAEYLFQQAPVSYLILNGLGLIQKCNETFCRQVDLDPGHAKGRGLSDFLKAEDRRTFHGRYRALFERPEGKRMEFTLVNGARVMLEAGRPFIGLDGIDPDQLLLVALSDITELRRLQEEQSLIEDRLHQTQKLESLGSLASGVAHDMNNVLAAILAVVDAQLHSGFHPVRGPEGLHLIRQACLKGRSMVQRLLAFTRKSIAERTHVDLNELVREEIALLERTTLGRISLETDLASDLPPIMGDPASLSHALMNLCVNAVEALPTGGRLRVQTRALPEGEVSLEVADTGPGMPPTVKARCFDPFFSTKPEGTGLGLSMVYGTVKAHGGRIELESEAGVGTTFRLILPCRETEASLPPDATDRALDPAKPEQEARNSKVLVVDDQALMQATVAGLLQVLGYQPLVAASGEEALVLLGECADVDLVILDVNMPGLGGEGTLPLLRAGHPKLPVILYTGRPDRAVLDLCRAYEGVQCLSKPFTAAELEAKITPLLPR